jgi:hypothetical protein
MTMAAIRTDSHPEELCRRCDIPCRSEDLSMSRFVIKEIDRFEKESQCRFAEPEIFLQEISGPPGTDFGVGIAIGKENR